MSGHAYTVVGIWHDNNQSFATGIVAEKRSPQSAIEAALKAIECDDPERVRIVSIFPGRHRDKWDDKEKQRTGFQYW